jgi:Nif-specific regulatory protein
VPISLNRRAIGALAIDLKYKAERNFERSTKFLGVVASLIAQAVKIHRLIEEDKRTLVDENMHLRQELRERYDFSNLVGSSGPMRQIFEQVTQVAGTNTTALIRGESGTGKELIAHAIHYSSLRAKKPFVKVSCAALPGQPDRVRAVRLRERARSPAPNRARRGASSSPKAARSSSTRSATSIWRPR